MRYSDSMNTAISIAEHTRFANMVTRVAVENKGKYLMVQEGKPHVRGLWAFPGGKMDVGETLSQSAVREIREETGVEIELQGILGMQFVLWEDRPGFTYQLDLAATAIKIPEKFRLSEEILAVQWKSPQEIQELVSKDLLRNWGQSVTARSIASGLSLPMSALTEGAEPPPAEANR